VNVNGWEYCVHSPRRFDVISAVLEPSPPGRGQDANVMVKGRVDEQLTGGTVKIDVSITGVKVYSTTEELRNIASLPVGPGDLEFVKKFTIPTVVPPGDYSLSVTLINEATEPLACVLLTFHMN